VFDLVPSFQLLALLHTANSDRTCLPFRFGSWNKTTYAVADFRLPISDFSSSIALLQIGNWQSEIGIEFIFP
jgi:hypothetical protein